MNASQRPDWARDEEWKGWTSPKKYNGQMVVRMFRSNHEGIVSVFITSMGVLYFQIGDHRHPILPANRTFNNSPPRESLYLTCQSPEDARTAADGMAQATNGWIKNG